MTQEPIVVRRRRFSNEPGASSSHIAKIDSVYFDAEDTSSIVPFSKNILANNNMTNSINTKSDLNNRQSNSRISDECSGM